MRNLFKTKKRKVLAIVLLLVIAAGVTFIIATYQRKDKLQQQTTGFERQIKKDGFAEIEEYQKAVKKAQTVLKNGNWQEIWLMTGTMNKMIKAEKIAKDQYDSLKADIASYDRKMEQYAFTHITTLNKTRTEAANVLDKKQISLLKKSDQKILKYTDKIEQLGKLTSPVRDNEWDWSEKVRRYGYFNENLQEEWTEKVKSYHQCLQKLNEKTVETTVKDMTDAIGEYDEKYAHLLKKQMEANEAYAQLLKDRHEEYDGCTEHRFLLLDCDGDGVKEMLEYMKRDDWSEGEENLYAYRDGKVIEIGGIEPDQEDQYYLDTEHHKLMYVYDGFGDSEDYGMPNKIEIYEIKNGKTELQDEAEYDSNWFDDVGEAQEKYLLNDEEITEADYREYCESMKEEAEASYNNLEYIQWPISWKKQAEDVYGDFIGEFVAELYPKIPDTEFKFTAKRNKKIKVAPGQYSKEDIFGADLDGDGIKDRFVPEGINYQEAGPAFCFNGKHYVSPDSKYYGNGAGADLFQFPDGQSVVMIESSGGSDWPDGSTLITFRNGKPYRIPCDELSENPTYTILGAGEDYVLLQYLNNMVNATGNFVYDRKLYFKDGKVELGGPCFVSKESQRTWTAKKEFQVYRESDCMKKAFKVKKGMHVTFITFEKHKIKIKADNGKIGWFQDVDLNMEPLFRGAVFAG